MNTGESDDGELDIEGDDDEGSMGEGIEMVNTPQVGSNNIKNKDDKVDNFV